MNALAAAYLRDAIVQTVGIACASFFLAVLAGVPLALLAARRGPLGATVRTLVTVVRAVPDLVLAIVAVVALGLGTVAAVAALALHYAAVLAKLISELLGSVRRDAEETLRAGGATATAAFVVALVPAAWPALVGFGAYAFESIVRASVIVGIVGAGGIGGLLIQQLNLAEYRSVGVTVVALALLVAAIDLVAERLRLRASPPVVGLVLVATGVGGALALALSDDGAARVAASAPAHLLGFIAGALPPDLSAPTVRGALAGAAVSVAVALAGTVAGAVLALPLAALGATPLTRGWMRGTGWRPASLAPEYASRATLVATRAVPPVALALVAVITVGIGPLAGAVALTLHTAGILGKLLAESLDVADRRPAEALVAAGATASAATAIALVPSAAGALAAHVLYRFEWNVRASTVLGMVGAGGLGSAIFEAQQLLFYRRLATDVAVAVLLVLAIDALSRRLREQRRLVAQPI